MPSLSRAWLTQTCIFSKLVSLTRCHTGKERSKTRFDWISNAVVGISQHHYLPWNQVNSSVIGSPFFWCLVIPRLEFDIRLKRLSNVESSFVFSLCVTFLWEIVALDRAIIYPIWLYSRTLLDKYSECKPISFSFVWARFITSATKFVIVIWESSSSHKAAGMEKELPFECWVPIMRGFHRLSVVDPSLSSCIVVWWFV